MIAIRCAPEGVLPTDVAVAVDLARAWRDAQLVQAESAGASHSPGLGFERVSFALVDATVGALHPRRLPDGVPRFDLPGGEPTKTLARLEDVLRAMARADVQRDGVLLVAGGGSLGDLGGLAASLYCRGIAHVLVPTTLLAMVDSSIGGKTAVDLPEGKNLVGTFHPPRRVLIDLAFLSTLSRAEYLSGLGEVLKVAIGLSPELFTLLEESGSGVLARDPDLLREVILLALHAKIALVEADFQERGPRRLLNLGHTLGHALEAHSGFALRHGLAVARGIHLALDVAQRHGCLAAADADRARRLLQSYGFTADPLPAAAELEPFVRRDKKAHGASLHFVVPTAIGSSRTIELAVDEVLRG